MKIKREITLTPDEVQRAIYEFLSNNTDHSPQSHEELTITVEGDERLSSLVNSLESGPSGPSLRAVWTEEH